MKFNILLVLLVTLNFQYSLSQERIDLIGEWTMKMDHENEGISKEWFANIPFNNNIQLPGCIQEQGYGDIPNIDTKWWYGKTLYEWFKPSPWLKEFQSADNFKTQAWLVPERHYIGAVWYAKQIEIPEHWNKKHLTLFLERCHWETRLWINGKYAGSNRSLATPHIYNLSELKPGKHQVVLRVDNSKIVDLGKMAHSVSEQTAGSWNGIVGKIELQMEDPVWIENFQIYPNLEKKSVKIKGTITKLQDQNKGTWELNIEVTGYNNGNTHSPKLEKVLGELKDSINTSFEFDYFMGEEFKLWDEFDPNLYKMKLTLNSKIGDKSYSNTKSKSFGMRNFKIDGRQFVMNDIKTFLRGNTDCAVNPKTGYAPMDVPSWKKIWTSYKDFGLNMARFHSWCPPEAAFIAADEMGIYLAPEVGEWATIKSKDQFDFLQEEAISILDNYGNNPSFIQLGLGNERSGNKKYFHKLIKEWKLKDSRHLYTIKANSRANPENIDYEVVRSVGKPQLKLRYQGGWPPTPMNTEFQKQSPQTDINWNKGILSRDIPLIQHETAQICAYPDLDNELSNYTGYLRPTYLEIALKQLKDRGMYSQLSDFVEVSGKWQIELTKEEFEAGYRTKELGGFHWLSLGDFTGQNTAPVGFTDAFYNTKSYVIPSLIREWNAPTVLLARMEQRIFKSSETFKAKIEVSHYGKEKLLLDDLIATLTTEDGEVIKEWKFDQMNYCQGSAQKIDEISFGLQKISVPTKLKLELKSKNNKLSNNWNIWVFPNVTPPNISKDIIITNTWNRAIEKKLEQGKTVLLLPEIGSLKGELPICFTNYYWTSFGENEGQSSAAGVLIQNNHPIFNQFPTENHSNWQWWDMLTQCQPMIFDSYDSKNPWPKQYKPVIQPIDSWKINRKLALIAEAKVSKGKLLICSIDIETGLENRPAAQQFRTSLFNYLTSDSFAPQTKVSTEMVKELFKKQVEKEKVKENGVNLPSDG